MSEYHAISRYGQKITVDNEVAIKLGLRSTNNEVFTEIRGSKDDVIDVLLAFASVIFVAGIMVAILKG